MASSRRMGAETSAIRGELIEAAALILEEEGVAGLTARRLAEKVGLKRQIVHYYFGAMDDLLVAVIRVKAEKNLARLDELLDRDPLRAVWEICGSPSATAPVFELNALAIRRPAIQAEMRRYDEVFHRRVAEALDGRFTARGIKPAVAPIAMTHLVAGVASTLGFEGVIQAERGHAELKALLEDWMAAYLETGELPGRTGG